MDQSSRLFLEAEGQLGNQLWEPSDLSAFLNSPLGRDQIFGTEAGVTREGLNYGQIRSFRVPLAPLAEQKLIVQKVTDVFTRSYTVETNASEVLNNSTALEQSILSRAFRGELVRQDPNDEPAPVLLNKIKAQPVVVKKGRTPTLVEFG